MQSDYSVVEALAALALLVRSKAFDGVSMDIPSPLPRQETRNFLVFCNTYVCSRW